MVFIVVGSFVIRVIVLTHEFSWRANRQDKTAQLFLLRPVQSALPLVVRTDNML